MGISKTFTTSMALFVLASCGINHNDSNIIREMHNYSIYNDGITFKNDLWQTPEVIEVKEKDKSENIKALYIRSDFNNNESYAFAYLGKPSIKKDKYNAILLLHGGGGTAYYEWVQKWIDRGYVALAIDLEGHTPKDNGTLTSFPSDLYEKSPYVAPHNSNLSDENDDLELTWLHYACRTAIIGNSYLHSLNYVDKYKIGICGVSRGGFIASIITGYDDRFAFSLPIYCTVGLEDSGSTLGTYISNHPKFRVFDSTLPITNVNTPFHLFVSNCDQFENPFRGAEVALSTKNGGISIYNKFQHSQYDATNLEDPYVYADRILNNEKEISVSLKDNKVTISNNTKYKIVSYEVYYTEEKLPLNNAFWYSEELDLKDNSLPINLDVKTLTYCYVSILDERGITTSSNVVNYKK